MATIDEERRVIPENRRRLERPNMSQDATSDDAGRGGTMPTRHFTETTQDKGVSGSVLPLWDRADRWMQGLRRSVSHYPVTAMAFAFAVGALTVRLRKR